jgi:hypothetical protein
MLASGADYVELLAMTLSRKVLILLITLAVAISTGVAIARGNPVFDRYGPITFADEKVRLRNYAIQLKNSRAERGVIIVYAGEPWNETAAKARARRAYNHLIKKEGIDAQRLKWSYGGVCTQGSVLLYLMPPELADPTFDVTCKR